GFTYVRPGDDGIQFTDKNDVVFAAVAKRRTDQDYVDLINRCFERAGELRRKCDSPNAKKNPRGAFSRAQYGTSFGGGQKEPTPISNGKRVTQAMVEFMTLDDTREMTGILAEQFKANFPKLVPRYKELNESLGLNKLFLRPGDDPDDFNFLFAAMTLNLGPQVATISHRDSKNLQPGVCAIIALGRFNPQTGGHFVMREPRLLVEFRPGDILFVMSSVITHFNVPLACSEEERMSWTFYTAGGLFRWQVAGKRTLKSLTTAEERSAYRNNARRFIKQRWSDLLTRKQLVQHWKTLARKA
ncbi:hypothetical protein AURDEDRAFT_178569, partial [Auricularia subglabra TFB-10046 SS5]